MILNPDTALVQALIDKHGQEKALKIRNAASALSLGLTGVPPETGLEAIRFLCALAEKTEGE